jgi:hypothetical protein
MRDVLDGNFAAAARLYRAGTPASAKLGTDPLVIHINDCHDCDHATYANAPWTHASLVARLAALERTARAGGEPGAQAALALGNALYNLTWYGNARVVLGDTHQGTADTTAALRWYKRAHDLTRNRELKAKAAFLAAKAELGNRITAQRGDPYDGSVNALPVPSTWFPVVARYKHTRYYREVLRECGQFARWVAGRKP